MKQITKKNNHSKVQFKELSTFLKFCAVGGIIYLVVATIAFSYGFITALATGV